MTGGISGGAIRQKQRLLSQNGLGDKSKSSNMEKAERRQVLTDGLLQKQACGGLTFALTGRSSEGTELCSKSRKLEFQIFTGRNDVNRDKESRRGHDVCRLTWRRAASVRSQPSGRKSTWVLRACRFPRCKYSHCRYQCDPQNVAVRRTPICRRDANWSNSE